MMTRPILFAARLTVVLSAMLLALTAIARAEVKIQEVVSPKGVKAWLVEDYTVPMVAIRFAFEGGSTQDPAGKEGLANLAASMFDEGAGDLESDAYQIKLDDAGAQMGFDADTDRFEGNMRMLADHKDEAFALLRLAVNKPRFDQSPLERMRARIVSDVVARQRDPNYAASVKWAAALYPGHPYSRQSQGTPETLAAITHDDLRAFHRTIFARPGLKIGVVGAIDAETLKAKLDDVFGELPEKSMMKPVSDVAPKLGVSVSVAYGLPQTSLQLVYPGIGHKAPDFYAANLLNHILGGGSVTSRLFDEVREKRGLTYGVQSALITSRHSNMLMVDTSTRQDRAKETLAVMRRVIAEVAANGVTQEELDAAKKHLIGAYPINSLNSSGAISRTLVELQVYELGIDYMMRRTILINAVTRDQVNAVAKKLLSVEPSILTVGPEQKRPG